MPLYVVAYAAEIFFIGFSQPPFIDCSADSALKGKRRMNRCDVIFRTPFPFKFPGSQLFRCAALAADCGKLIIAYSAHSIVHFIGNIGKNAFINSISAFSANRFIACFSSALRTSAFHYLAPSIIALRIAPSHATEFLLNIPKLDSPLNLLLSHTKHFMPCFFAALI